MDDLDVLESIWLRLTNIEFRNVTFHNKIDRDNLYDVQAFLEERILPLIKRVRALENELKELKHSKQIVDLAQDRATSKIKKLERDLTRERIETAAAIKKALSSSGAHISTAKDPGTAL